MKKRFLTYLFIFSSLIAFSQVGINTTNPSPASVLDVESSSDNVNYGGFLPPRVSLTQRNSIPVTAADDGLMVFLQEGTTRCLQLYDGVNDQWEDVYCMPIVTTDPWINEIHYDDNSTDDNEAVEIAGPAGTNLSGWTIILYNGNGGASYATISLSGTIDDEGSAYGALNFMQAGIQNGAPDGLALVDGFNNVIQFLSYEGSFTATDGAASGMTSTDIGVSESSSSSEGLSLQLIGTGNSYSDFSWTGSTTHSRGNINSGQTIN